MIGPLFVVDEVVVQEGQQVLVGTLFNKSRSDTETVALSVQQGAATFGSVEADLKDAATMLKEVFKTIAKDKADLTL